MALSFPIYYGQSFIKLGAFVAHNNASEVLLVKRLRQPLIATAKELIRVYGLALVKARDIAPLSIENLTSLRTNNIQLSKFLICSPGNINNILIGAEKNMDSLSFNTKIITGNTSEHTREKVSKKILTREKVQKRDTWQIGVQVKSQESLSRSAFLKGYVDSFWKLAKETLYNDKFLLEYQIKQVKNLLLEWYKPVELSELDRVHTIFKERLLLAKKYVNKDPIKRFISPPYLYFDLTNKNGLAGTKIWWQRMCKRKAKTQLKLITHTLLQVFYATVLTQNTHQLFHQKN